MAIITAKRFSLASFSSFCRARSEIWGYARTNSTIDWPKRGGKRREQQMTLTQLACKDCRTSFLPSAFLLLLAFPLQLTLSNVRLSFCQLRAKPSNSCATNCFSDYDIVIRPRSVAKNAFGFPPRNNLNSSSSFSHTFIIVCKFQRSSSFHKKWLLNKCFARFKQHKVQTMFSTPTRFSNTA